MRGSLDEAAVTAVPFRFAACDIFKLAVFSAGRLLASALALVAAACAAIPQTMAGPIPMRARAVVADAPAVFRTRFQIVAKTAFSVGFARHARQISRTR